METRPTRHGYPLAIDTDDFEIDKVQMFAYSAPEKLRGYTVVIAYKITSGEFAGSFLGEEYHGAEHPFLIIPASEVTLRSEHAKTN